MVHLAEAVAGITHQEEHLNQHLVEHLNPHPGERLNLHLEDQLEIRDHLGTLHLHQPPEM